MPMPPRRKSIGRIRPLFEPKWGAINNLSPEDKAVLFRQFPEWQGLSALRSDRADSGNVRDDGKSRVTAATKDLLLFCQRRRLTISTSL